VRQQNTNVSGTRVGYDNKELLSHNLCQSIYPINSMTELVHDSNILSVNLRNKNRSAPQNPIGSCSTDKSLLFLSTGFPLTTLWTQTSFFSYFLHISLPPFYRHRQIFFLPLLIHFPATTLLGTHTSFIYHLF
jgi:hypothetical protein